jgi:hypothetical protein
VRETLKGVALLVLKRLTEKYGGEAETSASAMFSQPPAPAAAPQRASGGRSTTSGPLEVEDLGAGEMLEEIEELPVTQAGGPVTGVGAHGNSVVEVPVVLDRSLFSGDSPVEIRLKLYLK